MRLFHRNRGRSEEYGGDEHRQRSKTTHGSNPPVTPAPPQPRLRIARDDQCRSRVRVRQLKSAWISIGSPTACPTGLIFGRDRAIETSMRIALHLAGHPPELRAP